MKNKEGFYFLTTMLLALVCASLLVVISVQKSDTEIRVALDSCIQEVATKCKGLYEYSVSLEAENSRLNEKLNRCKNEDR